MKKSKNLFACFTDVHSVVAMALFIALSIIFGKFLAFNITSSLRISFENLPILFAGIIFGPISGGVVGLVADITGCIAVGYSINPLITLGAVSVGFVSGVLSRFLIKDNKRNYFRVFICVLFA